MLFRLSTTALRIISSVVPSSKSVKQQDAPLRIGDTERERWLRFGDIEHERECDLRSHLLVSGERQGDLEILREGDPRDGARYVLREGDLDMDLDLRLLGEGEGDLDKDLDRDLFN